jgi:hypothetical protein
MSICNLGNQRKHGDQKVSGDFIDRGNMVSKVTVETTQTLILVTEEFVVMLLIEVIINVHGRSCYLSL